MIPQRATAPLDPRVLQLLIVLLLMLCNGFFAMSEMAVLTSRKSRLKHLAEHSRRARKALYLAEHPEGFLSAVQLWITLLGLVIGYLAVNRWARAWPSRCARSPCWRPTPTRSASSPVSW